MSVLVAAPNETELTTQAGDWELIPNKTQLAAEITQIDLRENKAQDGHYLNVAVQIGAGPWAKRTVYGMVSLKRNSLWRLHEYLRAMGWDEATLQKDILFYDSRMEDTPDVTGTAMIPYDVTYFLDSPCEVQVTVETYLGKQSNKIKQFLPPFAGHPPASEDDVPF